MKSRHSKGYSLFYFLFSFLISALLLTACASAPDVNVNTRPPRSSGTSPTQTLPDISTQKGTVASPAVSNPPATSSKPSDQKPELVLDLDESAEIIFDSSKNGFSVYFSSDYIYSFENGSECILTITSGNESFYASGTVDLTLGKKDFNEEGIFKGVGFVTDFEFIGSRSYSISVKIPSSTYTYVFSFDFTR